MPARRTSATVKSLIERPMLSPVPASGGAAVLLQAPDWLSKPARVWFEHFAGVMASLRTSREADGAIVTELACAAAEVERARAEVDALPSLTYSSVTTTGGTIHRPYPQIALHADASKRLKALLETCGLTPAAATKADSHHV